MKVFLKVTIDAKEDNIEIHGTCDNCGGILEVCCDGIERCLDCAPCPACYDGGDPLVSETLDGSLIYNHVFDCED